ncbi:hypothetical protein TNCV_2783801 [Trichonephila clavipes]|nr:hypothetical protein TNCV_2783801 [Trichonephila clavipes]
MPGPLGYPATLYGVKSPCWYGVVWRGENGQAGPSRGKEISCSDSGYAEWKEILPQRMPNSKVNVDQILRKPQERDRVNV